MLCLFIYSLTYCTEEGIEDNHLEIESKICHSMRHRWELPCNYPVFSVEMIIYHYVKIIWRIIVTPIVSYNIYENERYYPGELVNRHIQPLINIYQEKNWVITTKKG